VNDLRDGQVKGFSVNASFQSVAEVQREYTIGDYCDPIIIASSFSCQIAARYCPADGLLHDEISFLVAAEPRKILAISANNLQDVFYFVHIALPLAPRARRWKNRLLYF
jgi:hypothetical protein